MATDSGLSVLAWAQERHDNSVQIASTKTGGDRVGWLEDVTYWTAIIDALSENERLRIACASGWGEPVLVNTLRAERDAARAERDALLVQVDQWRQMADREVTACVEMRAERDEARLSNTVTEHHTIQQLSAALTEARRVLRMIRELFPDTGTPDPDRSVALYYGQVQQALAAVLAQEPTR